MVEFTRKVICDCCGEEVEDLFGGYDTISLSAPRAYGHKRLYDLCIPCSEILAYKREVWEREMIVKMFDHETGREDPEHE